MKLYLAVIMFSAVSAWTNTSVKIFNDTEAVQGFIKCLGDLANVTKVGSHGTPDFMVENVNNSKELEVAFRAIKKCIGEYTNIGSFAVDNDLKFDYEDSPKVINGQRTAYPPDTRRIRELTESSVLYEIDPYAEPNTTCSCTEPNVSDAIGSNNDTENARHSIEPCVLYTLAGQAQTLKALIKPQNSRT